MKKIDTKYKIGIFVIVLILLEQLTKVIILLNKDKLPITVINNVLNLSYVENSGAAFGIKVGSVWTFILVNIVVLGILIKFVHCQMSKLNSKIVIILSLIIAGGISNLIDRIFRGYVVDFIDITPIVNFPVFNFADIMIVVAVLVFGFIVIKNTIMENRKEIKNGESNSTK